MQMWELIKYDIPREVVDVWEAEEGPHLLPVQERAVRSPRLFDGGNLIIQAPTSAGKTFIGEIAAVHAALARKKVCYLVPLKALAEEKYTDFCKKYSRYGIEVVVSTRDRREFDSALDRGKFSIAVMVYEKMAQWLARRPDRLADVSLVVVDELEMLFADSRGPTLDMLLTQVMSHDPRPQVLGMSAVLDDGPGLSRWLDAETVKCEDRPVELRKGVLFDGRFVYRTEPGGRQAEESLSIPRSTSVKHMLLDAVGWFARHGEQTLVFVKGRADSRRIAVDLAESMELAPATDAIETVRSLEPTRSRDALLDTMARAVAFHNADMSADERRAVESQFRTGALRVVVSTSTLALGLNLPATNVLIEPDKWQYDTRFGIPWRTPITFGEYENMSGRAGRLADGVTFGRSVLVAGSPYERDVLWRRYIEGRPEPLTPGTDDTRLAGQVLTVVASHRTAPIDTVHRQLNRSLTAQLRWHHELTPDEITAKLDIAVDEAVGSGAIDRQEDGRLTVTPFGTSVVQHGIGIDTADTLRTWIAEVHGHTWHDTDALVTVGLTDDGRMTFVTLSGREYEHAGYFDKLGAIVDGFDDTADTPLNRLRRSDLPPLFDEMKSVKVALILNDWINGVQIRDIEDRYRTMSGQIKPAAEQAAWLINATCAIATSMAVSTEFRDRLDTLATRLAYGIPASGVELAELGLRTLTRDHISILLAHGITSADSLYRYPLGDLAQLIPKSVIAELSKSGQRNTDRHEPDQPAGTSHPAIEIQTDHPGSVRIDGREISLPKKQYTLLTALARSPGRCVPYATIYTALWGQDVVVQPAQINQHKCKLLQRLARVHPRFAKIIRTVPKHGFTLDLPLHDVLLLT